MKTKRTTFVAFLLCAILMLSIGFAAVVDDLAITGSITSNSDVTQVLFKERVYFSNAVVEYPDKATAGDEARILANANAGDDKDVVDLIVKSLKKKDDSTAFVLTIKNDAQEYDAKITLGTPTVDGDTTYFSVKYLKKVNTEFVEIDSNGFTCASGGTVDIKVVVTLLSSPDVVINGTFGVNLTATSVAKSN